MFNLSFLNSGILLATLAAVIPLLIYLFAKKRPHKIVFSSIKFIKLSQKQQKKKINLINIILLIIRMLIILLLVLAISRPSVKTPLLKTSELHPPTAVAIIIDNSPSMDYLVNTKTNLDKAIVIGNDINKILSESDATVMLTLDQSWNELNSSIKFGKFTNNDFENINISSMPLEPSVVIEQAENMLEESQLLNKEIYFITDGQKEILPESFKFPTYYIITDSLDIWNNISCSDVSIVRNFVNKQLNQQLNFSLTNHSQYDQEDVLYRLVINNTATSEKIVNLNGYQTKELSFDIELQQQGWKSGYVEVQNERFTWDNRSYFSLYNETSPSLAVISKDSKLPLTLTIILELYSGSFNNIEIINQDDINFEQLNKYDFLIVYKPDQLNHRIEFLLDSYLEQDKGIFFISDVQLSNEWRAWLENVFTVKFETFNSEKSNIAAKDINKYHPITAMISESNGMELRDFWNIKAEEGILVKAEKYPIILEKDNSFLWTFDPSSLRSPLLVDSSYPVMLYNTLLYLSKKGFDNNNYKIGDIIILKDNSITLPNGETINWQQSRYIFKEAGIYQLDNEMIPINVDLEESKYNHYKNIKKNNFEICRNDWNERILQSRYGYELWKLLLLLVLILFAAEMILIKREEKRKR